MRFIHSLNTKPYSIQLYDRDMKRMKVDNVWYYALSLAYLKRLNQEVVLYTDELGLSYLGYLPYDEIIAIDKDDPTINDVHPRFWAAAKMWALAHEDVGSVHIDGDVFIKKRSLIENLERGEYDLVVQNYEHGGWYKRDAEIMWRDKEFCAGFGLSLDDCGAYNTGMLGFMNGGLKDKFIEGYKSIVLHFSELYGRELSEGTGMTPDIVVEQQFVYQLSRGYKVKTLLDSAFTSKEFCAEANRIGYQHLICNKYQETEKAMEILRILSPEIYESTKSKCDTLDR